MPFKKSSDNTDRRKYIRIDSQAEVRFQIKKGSPAAGDKGSAIMKNLSVEGVCFFSERELSPSSRVILEIMIPLETEPLHLEGEVVWSRPLKGRGKKALFETGIRVFTLEKSDEARFVKFACSSIGKNVTFFPPQ